MTDAAKPMGMEEELRLALAAHDVNPPRDCYCVACEAVRHVLIHLRRDREALQKMRQEMANVLPIRITDRDGNMVREDPCVRWLAALDSILEEKP